MSYKGAKMAYSPTPIVSPADYQLKFHWQKRKLDYEIPDYRRGFGYQAWSNGYQAWSNNLPTVSDPAGCADFMSIWWAGKRRVITLDIFREPRQ